MTFKPAHKETDPDHLPGQIVNGLTPRNELVLSDYIERKERTYNPKEFKPKLTFDEWYDLAPRTLDDISLRAFCRFVWNQARENT